MLCAKRHRTANAVCCSEHYIMVMPHVFVRGEDNSEENTQKSLLQYYAIVL